MRRFCKYLIIFITILTITGCGKGSLTEIKYKDFETKLSNKETFIFEVMQTGCSHCEEFDPRFEAILKKYNIKAYYINLKNMSNKDYQAFNDEFVVDGTPTVLFINKGEETSKMLRINGSVSDNKIISKLKFNGYIK